MNVEGGKARHSEDMILTAAEHSVEVVTKKARDLLDASAALEISLREHKDVLHNLTGLAEKKRMVSSTEPAFSLPGAIEDGERMAPPAPQDAGPGHPKHTSAWVESASAASDNSSKQSKKKKSTEVQDNLSSVVPAAPQLPAGSHQPSTGSQDEAEHKPAAGGKLVSRATHFAETFMQDMNKGGDDGESEESKGEGYRWKVRRLLANPAFDITIGTLIILNALSIGFESDWHVQNWSATEAPVIFTVIEKIFAVVFTGELCLRIFGKGFIGFYFGPEWKWAIFDSIIVGLQIIEEISELAVGPEAASNSNLGFMRVMRILRLLRIMRLVRLLQFVNELRTMVMSIVGSMKSLVWTLLLMLLMKYIIGVFLCQLIVDTSAENPAIMTGDLIEYYGNLPRAVLSLYQAMTGGVDWNDLSKPLETSIGPIMTIVFALYVAFAVLAMMNVVTGVFVESALGSAREEREKEVIGLVKKIFQVADHDQSGVLTWGEFSKTLEEPSNLKYFNSLGINPREARGLFTLLDADESGSVSLQEFMQGCLRLRGQAKSIDMATLMYQNKRIVFWLQDRLERLEQSLLNETYGKAGPPAHSRHNSKDKVAPVIKTWMELTNEHKQEGKRRSK
mmetsp:Transcript_44057/g.82376  ORF Transcript_44057/g.82376 Transcript_44057/m.82376 type:complete len:620 (-) Transcript_44057:182-2041(-)